MNSNQHVFVVVVPYLNVLNWDILKVQKNVSFIYTEPNTNHEFFSLDQFLVSEGVTPVLQSIGKS